MPAFTATTPGKIILFGEHAVVYGRPALAVPVSRVRARAIVRAEAHRPSGYVRIQAPQIGLDAEWSQLPQDHPIARSIAVVLQELGIRQFPAFTLRVTSTIPMAAGLGSGAAVAVATIRALAAFLGHPLSKERVSALAFEVEKLHHGNPSGIDNTVVTYAQPIYFRRGSPFESLHVKRPFHLIIADSGVPSPTAFTVAEVRRGWEAERDNYEALFDAIGEIVQIARRHIEEGIPEALGLLMNQNHALLRKLGVSSPELDHLVNIACKAGALGAKLSGGGRGGNIIALTPKELIPDLTFALSEAGAVRVIATRVAAAAGGRNAAG